MGRIWRISLDNTVATQAHPDNDWIYVSGSSYDRYLAIRQDGSLWFCDPPKNAYSVSSKGPVPNDYFYPTTVDLDFQLLCHSHNFVLAIETHPYAFRSLIDRSDHASETYDNCDVLAIDIEGQAWALVAPRTREELIPQPVRILEDFTIIDAIPTVSAAVIFQTSDDQIWSFGDSDSEALGYRLAFRDQGMRPPTRILGPGDRLKSVRTIKKDSWGSSVNCRDTPKSRITAINKDGELWQWGSVRHLRQTPFSPAAALNIPSRTRELTNVEAVSLTPTHTYFVDADGNLHLYGAVGRPQDPLSLEPIYPEVFATDLTLGSSLQHFEAIQSPLLQHQPEKYREQRYDFFEPAYNFLAVVDHNQTLALFKMNLFPEHKRPPNLIRIKPKSITSEHSNKMSLFDLQIQHLDLYSHLAIG